MPSHSIDTYGSKYGRSDSFSAYRTVVVLAKEDQASRSAIVKTSEHARRKKEPHIWLPPTPMSASKTLRSLGNGVFRATWGEYWIGTQSLGVPIPPMNEVTNSNIDLESVAITRALANLKSQDINYSQAFGERAQTARLVVGSAKKIAAMYTCLRARDFSGAARALGVGASKSRYHSRRAWRNSKALGDAVLELNYGWKPLLSDIYGSVKDLAEKDKTTPNRYRITVRGSAKDGYDTGYINSISPNNGVSDWTGLTRAQLTRSSRVRLDYQLVHPTLAALASGGFTNPLTLAWELMPWSFVADWFVPVGGYLNCLDAALGYSFLGGSHTRRNTGEGAVVYTYPSGSSTRAQLSGSYCVDKWVSRKEVQRSVYGSSPLPRFPGFKNPYSATHLVNALALLRGSVR